MTLSLRHNRLIVDFVQNYGKIRLTVYRLIDKEQLMTASIINHNELEFLLSNLTHPEDLMHYVPRWISRERLLIMLSDYRHGLLNDLEVAQLESVLQVVPAFVEMVESGELR